MAMSNRVEELESQVADLQAAVDGLTEELVETRERLRQLEENDGVDNSRAPERRESTHAQVEHADTEPAPDPDPADADAETETDTPTEAEDDDGSDSDSDGNDIIVA